MKKNSPFIHGTIILTVSNLFSRLIGFYNRIFLAGLIGAHQMGVYQMIFPVYLVGFSLCLQGFQTALSKMCAAQKASGKEGASGKILRITIFFTLILSLLFSIFVFLNAKLICDRFFNEPDCIPCLQTAVLALPFVGIKSCIHSYCLGMDTPEIPALSLCVEQISRVSAIFLISVTFFIKLPSAALIAVLGMVFGEIISLGFTLLFYFFKRPSSGVSPVSARSLFHELLTLGVPLTCNAVSVTLLQSVQSILIPMMLTKFYGNKHQAVEVYGILTGMALPFLLFPSTITNSVSVMLLPKVSAVSTKGNSLSLQKISKKCLILCAFLGSIGFLGFFTFGPFIGKFVFHSSRCGNYLRFLSFLCPFLYLSGTLSSILNGLGKTKVTLFHNSISLIVQIMFILFVIPVYGIYGYLFGLLASSVLLVSLNYHHFKTSVFQ